MIFGLDLLAGAKYQKIVRASLPDHWALGGFAETFGDFYPVAEQSLKAGCKFLRIHLIWSDTHSFGDRDIPKIKKLAQKYNVLATKFSDARIYLSPFCEHNLKSPDKYLEIVQSSAPKCVVCNTPWKGAISKKFLNEIHGNHKPINEPYFYSIDGGLEYKTGKGHYDSVDCDIEWLKDRHKNAQVFFLWHSRFNLKWSIKDKTPRPQRKAKPTKSFIQSIIILSCERGAVRWPDSKWLCKSHAEKHGENDTKGDKLLIISPIKTKFLEIRSVSSGNDLVDKLNYYGPYEDGGYRYYSAKMGYQIRREFLGVFANGSQFGLIDPAFRYANFKHKK